MISDQDLLRLNKQGFIPGPTESEKDFLKRVDLSKKLVKDPKSFFENEKQKEPFDLDSKILKPRWNWTRAQLLNLFDVTCSDLALFYSDKNLHFFQAAATWIVEIKDKKIKIPVLQFRKVLRYKPYLFIYTLDEILAHEAVHSIRVAFNEPKTEEIFSYMTATSIFRRVIGPIIRSEKEVFLFFAMMGGYFISQILFILSNFQVFSYFSAFFGFLVLSLIGFGLIRLFLVRRKVKKTLKKLFKILKCKKQSRAVLFRLTDKEIFMFSKMKSQEIRDYIFKAKEKSLRLKMIYLSYLKKCAQLTS